MVIRPSESHRRRLVSKERAIDGFGCAPIGQTLEVHDQHTRSRKPNSVGEQE